VCGGVVMGTFHASELQLLVCGSPVLDFDDLEAGTRYEDGYEEDSVEIQNFWSIVREFDEDEKKRMLMFCTGSDRSPIDGLSAL
jgi:ubiquitin-protein ligase E3 A